MSADNWGICPQCKQNHEKEMDVAEKNLDKSYGKIPADQWKLAFDSLSLMKSKEFEHTLREDYQVWVDEDGNFTLDYRCSCSVCMFHYEEKIEKQILK